MSLLLAKLILGGLAALILLLAAGPVVADPHAKGPGPSPGIKHPPTAPRLPPALPGATPLPRVPTDGPRHYLDTTHALQADDPPPKEAPPKKEADDPPEVPPQPDAGDDGEDDDDRVIAELVALIKELDEEIQEYKDDIDEAVQEFLGTDGGQTAAARLLALEEQRREQAQDSVDQRVGELANIAADNPPNAEALIGAAWETFLEREEQRQTQHEQEVDTVLRAEMAIHSRSYAQEYDDLNYQLDLRTTDRDAAQAEIDGMLNLE